MEQKNINKKSMVEPEVLSAALAAHAVPIGSNYILNSGWTDAQRLEEQLGSVHSSLSSLQGATEEFSVGSRINGKMSAVRRFFCLFVLFDMLLIALAWLLCMMLTGGNQLIQILKKQILEYNISTSLFDIVLSAVCRFTVLLLFYGLLHLNTTFFVALTTLGTCVFLIFKVIYYSWTTASQPVVQILVVLGSFIIAWAEAWFLDFRVLPQELSALNYAQFSATNRLSQTLGFLDRNYRRPLMRNVMASEIGDGTETNGNFYSPLESPNDSGDEGETGNSAAETRKRKEEYVRLGKDTLEVAWSILNDSDWSFEKETPEGDRVYSKHKADLGKFFLLRTKIDMPPQRLLEELFSNVDKFAAWNKMVLESMRVELIDDHTDITYQVSSPGGNGSISSRDFVNLRHWDVKSKNAFALAAISCLHPSVPPCKNYVRGENGPCCWLMQPCKDPGSCQFQFLLNTNLKGWIPSKVVESALTSVLLNYASSLREYCKAINPQLKT